MISIHDNSMSSKGDIAMAGVVANRKLITSEESQVGEKDSGRRPVRRKQLAC